MPKQLRVRGLRLPSLAFACIFACACEPDAIVRVAAFELRTATGCELGAIEELELVALGDFPSLREGFDVRAPTATFEKFPLGTRELAIEGKFTSAESAGGRTTLVAAAGGTDSAMPSSIVVLPEGRSCPLSDLGIVAGEGAVVVALPRGGILIAGGTSSDGQVLSSAAAVAAGELIGTPVPDGMLQPRRYATGTVAGAWVVVAGGVADARSRADATFEVFDTARGRFAGELSRKLSNARMEHGAALLPDGNVLLVGGRSEPGGAPLATAELIRLAPPAPDPPGDLVDARVEPTVLVLDSGAVIVAGGRDEAGAVVPSLERLEAAAKRFVRLELLPSYENVAAVALPGARIAWLGCDTRSHACGLTLVLLRGDEPVQVDVALDWQSAAPLGLARLRAAALDDGRLLVTGRDPDATMMSRAFVIDLDARTIDEIEASRAPSVLAALADGAISELDAFGTSLRRLGSFSVYDSPQGNLLEPSARRIALDAPDRWKRASDGLRALVSGARVDIPHLQFGSFRLELRFEGEALIRIATTDATDLAIGAGARVSAPGCPQLPAAGRLVVERRSSGVAIKLDANAPDACVVPLPGSSPARLAIEAETDAVLHDLRVTRL